MTSPFKTTFECDATPNKKIVECEINGWMETCAKKPVVYSRRERVQRNVRIHPIVPADVGKVPRLTQLKGSLFKYALNKDSQRTQATAQDSNQLSISVNQPISNRSVRLPSVQNQQEKLHKLIEVSQFREEQTHEIIKVNQHTKIAMLRLPELPIKGFSRGMGRYLLGVDTSIIQSRLTENSYRVGKYLNRRLNSLTKY